MLYVILGYIRCEQELIHWQEPHKQYLFLIMMLICILLLALFRYVFLSLLLSLSKIPQRKECPLSIQMTFAFSLESLKEGGHLAEMWVSAYSENLFV